MARARENVAGGALPGRGHALTPVVWLRRAGAARGLYRAGAADSPRVPPARRAPALLGASRPWGSS